MTDAEAVAENETATDSAMTDATGHSEQEPEQTAWTDSVQEHATASETERAAEA